MPKGPFSTPSVPIHQVSNPIMPCFICVGNLVYQRETAHDYVEEHVVETQHTLGLHPARRGRVEVCEDLQEAVAGGWMVIEAVPERIDLKTAVFGDLDQFAEPDAILCSNSSSIPLARWSAKSSTPSVC